MVFSLLGGGGGGDCDLDCAADGDGDGDDAASSFDELHQRLAAIRRKRRDIARLRHQCHQHRTRVVGPCLQNTLECRRQVAVEMYQSTIWQRQALAQYLQLSVRWNVVLQDCFPIWHAGPWATINGARLGGDAPRLPAGLLMVQPSSSSSSNHYHQHPPNNGTNNNGGGPQQQQQQQQQHAAPAPPPQRRFFFWGSGGGVVAPAPEGTAMMEQQRQQQQQQNQASHATTSTTMMNNDGPSSSLSLSSSSNTTTNITTSYTTTNNNQNNNHHMLISDPQHPPASNNNNNNNDSHNKVPWLEVNAALGHVVLLLQLLQERCAWNTVCGAATNTNTNTNIITHELIPMGSTSQIGIRRRAPKSLLSSWTLTSSSEAAEEHEQNLQPFLPPVIFNLYFEQESHFALFKGGALRQFNVALSALLECVVQLQHSSGGGSAGGSGGSGNGGKVTTSSSSRTNGNGTTSTRSGPTTASSTSTSSMRRMKMVLPHTMHIPTEWTTAGGGTPPEIGGPPGTIGGIPFQYNEATAVDFTRACKYLLTNIKWLVAAHATKQGPPAPSTPSSTPPPYSKTTISTVPSASLPV